MGSRHLYAEASDVIASFAQLVSFATSESTPEARASIRLSLCRLRFGKLLTSRRRLNGLSLGG